MLLISREDILKVFTMRDAIEADKKAFVSHYKGMSDVPLRTNFSLKDGQSLFMSAYAKDINACGVKIVSVYPENSNKGLPAVPATMVLLDGETGLVSAIIEGTTLTQMRTGAIAGAATELLSREDSTVGALFGTGGQAASQLEALLTVRPLKEVRVFDIDIDRSQAFVDAQKALSERFNAKIRVAKSPDEAVEDADVITAVTTSRHPVFDGKKIKEGAHVNGVGAYTPEMQELDSALIERADKIFVDNKEAVLAEAGDFIIPTREGKFSEDRIHGELGALIENDVKGRESNSEITLFKTVGFATLDVVAAYTIYQRAKEAGVGQEIRL